MSCNRRFSLPIAVLFFASANILAIQAIEGESQDDSSTSQTEPTDEEIVNAIYDPEKKYLSEYYGQDYLRGHYITEYSLRSAYERSGVSTAPLCTNDINQARTWAQEANNNFSRIRYFEEEKETDRYFEFALVSPGEAHVLLLKVDKCSYLNRSQSAIDSNTNGPGRFDSSATETVGYLNSKPITAKKVDELIYYLLGTRVLSSSSAEFDEMIKHTVYEIRLISGDYGLNDEIVLNKSVYFVDKETGLIERTTTQIRTIKGKYNEKPDLLFRK